LILRLEGRLDRMNRFQVLESIKENHPSGATLVEVSKEELERVYGGGDVQPETTTPCAYTIGVTIGITLSMWKC
jgi:type 2 lantibiotic (TIGR03893 family)